MAKSSRKIVVDTNVILFDALAVSKFRNAEVYVPLSVIEEIDRFKRDPGENGRNARHFSRFIDVLREKGSLPKGVVLQDGESKIFVMPDMTTGSIPADMFESKADNRILMTAIALAKEDPNASVELVSKDINLRIKATFLALLPKTMSRSKFLLRRCIRGMPRSRSLPIKSINFTKRKFSLSVKNINFFPINILLPRMPLTKITAPLDVSMPAKMR